LLVLGSTVSIFMSNPHSDQLFALCQQLYQQGTTPNIALLRAKAPGKVSITQAIDAIKRFNSAAKPALKEAGSPPTEAQKIQSLEKRVAELEAAITVLEQRISSVIPEAGAPAPE